MISKWKVQFDPDLVLDKTMELVIVPFQENIASAMLMNILKIIDDENIIRTGLYRESITPTGLPTKEDPTVSIVSVGCPYAVHLEYGTNKMQAKAVFRRAMAELKKQLGG